MEKEARFILKADKYSLLIIHLIDSNKKTKKGISIYNKTLEMNELNEDNINMVLNKKDKIVYSFANIGLIEIAGIKCFMYCSEKDVKEVGIISFTKIYKILNISYLVLEDMDTNMASEIITFFKEHSKSEVNKGLFFAQDVYNMDRSFDVFFHRLYEMNKNVCHINPDINFCYNYDNISFFEKFGFKDFTTHVISGYFNQSIINVTKKEEFISNLIIKDKEIYDDKFIKNNDIKEIEIIFCPNNNIFLNQIFHIIFYVFSGVYLDAKIVLNDILKKNQSQKRVDNGAIIVIDIDNLVDKNEDKKPDIINKEIEEELNQIIGSNNKLIIIHKKKEIPKIIKNDKNKNFFSEIKYNYEFKGEDFILEFQEKQLLIISDSQEHFITIIENILDFIQYPFAEKQGGLKYQIKTNVKSMLNSYKEFNKTSNSLKTAKLKVEAINENYFKEKSINQFKQDNNKNLELKEKEKENNNNITINEENKKDENKKENNEITINKNSDSESNKLSQNIDEKNNNKYLYIVTYNTANYTFENTEDENSILGELLFPKKIRDIFQDGEIPTFLVIGLQEIVKLNTSNVIFDANKSSSYLWEAKITEKILQDYNYTLQYRENMVGVLFLIFVKSSELKKIKNMKKSIIKAGFMKALGNKGYIIYEFKYKDKTFSFGTGHLTAGENDKNFKERTNLLIDFLNHKSDKNSNKLHESDFYFLFGDMNFRVKSDKKEFLDIFEQVKDINLKNKINDDSVIGKTKLLCNYARNLDIGLKSENKRTRNIKSAKKNDIYKYKYFKNFIEKNYNDEDSYNINFSAKRKLDEPRYKYFFSKKHLENDELNGFKNSLKNYNITEKEINFLPTYKYIKGYNYYDISKRTPAWTDRILYKKSDDIKCIQYDKINIKISDHRPVFGLFEIKI